MFMVQPKSLKDIAVMDAILMWFKVHSEEVVSSNPNLNSHQYIEVRSIEGYEDDYNLAEMSMEINFHQVSCPICDSICGHLCFSEVI